MSQSSRIEWTEVTWNPVTGCSKVSPGCAHCYAETLSLRFGHSRLPWTPENAAENVIVHPERLEAPLTWRKPRMVFVNSMSDLFHEQVPDSFIASVFSVMAIAQRHTFQVLTKRPERMRDYCRTIVPLPNVWLGVSAENQRWADERIPLLLDTPATVRFVSLEPLLGPIDFRCGCGALGTACPKGASLIEGLDWVIVGGESGPKHRPMDVAWVEGIADQCDAAGVPLFVKQDSGPYPGKQGRLSDALWRRKTFPRRA